MVLKLKVHWRTKPLHVDYDDNDVIHVIKKLGSSRHVQKEGNVVLVKNFFKEKNKVPDVSRYSIGAGGCCVRHNNRYHICNDKYLIPHCDISEQDMQQQIPNIVLLLESPHKDEYQSGNINCPIAPANGTTGDNIDRCLGTVLLHIQNETGLIESGCHVIISNPIQFQTSLYAAYKSEPPKEWRTLRDCVWRTLWNETHIRRCFQKRLEGYHPTMIINACTGDLKKKDSLKSLVNKFVLKKKKLNVPLYAVAHPASWQNLRPALINPQAISNAGNPP